MMLLIMCGDLFVGPPRLERPRGLRTQGRVWEDAEGGRGEDGGGIGPLSLYTHEAIVP